jgi:hypothetical protein
MDWVAEVHPQRLLEAERALDHQIGNQVQRAYLRTDFLEQRRELAELWAVYLAGKTCGYPTLPMFRRLNTAASMRDRNNETDQRVAEW